jgi:hypothetical protein
MKTISNITLYELMSEPVSVWVNKNKGFGFDIQIDDEYGKSLVEETKIHPFAADSFADFCRAYLNSYEHALAHDAA